MKLNGYTDKPIGRVKCFIPTAQKGETADHHATQGGNRSTHHGRRFAIHAKQIHKDRSSHASPMGTQVRSFGNVYGRTECCIFRYKR